MLTKRRGELLRLLVREHIDRAVPVASEALVRNYGLPLSPATVRNELALLEEEGYIVRPHTSAGAVPLDTAYRFYVDSLEEEGKLPLPEERRIRHQFHQIEREMEEWAKLSASLLSRMVGLLGWSTLPMAPRCHFRNLKLLGINDFVILLVLLLETRLKQRFLFQEEGISEPQLEAAAARLNKSFHDLTASEIKSWKGQLTPLEEQVRRAATQLMEVEDEEGYPDPRLEGLRLMLAQPEFTSRERLASFLEILEGRRLAQWLKEISLVLPWKDRNIGEVRVVIGEENREEALHPYSVILTNYGIPEEARGFLGVVGPTRMEYGRAITAVRSIASILNELVAEVWS